MACVWTRPEPETELYGLVLLGALGALPFLRRSPESTPLLVGREAWADGARGMLAMLIVVGHFAALPTVWIPEGTYWLTPLLSWSNLFMMPGFAVLSGFLSKGELTGSRVSRLLIYVALPYLLTKAAIWVVSSVLRRELLQFNPLDTFNNGNVQWYLIVLIQWRIALHVLRPIGRGPLLAASIVLGLASGNWVPTSSLLGLHRACSFAPFFVAGHVLDVSAARSCSARPWLRASFVLALAALALSPAVATAFMPSGRGGFDDDYTRSFKVCGTEWTLSFVYRGARYVLAGLLVAGAIAWAPVSAPFTALGRYAMYPYLLHPFVCDLAVLPWLGAHPNFLVHSLAPFRAGGWVWGYVLLLGPLLALVLGSGPVRLLTGVMVEPKWAARLLAPEYAAEFLPKRDLIKR